jgi:hypothetical protein
MSYIKENIVVLLMGALIIRIMPQCSRMLKYIKMITLPDGNSLVSPHK